MRVGSTSICIQRPSIKLHFYHQIRSRCRALKSRNFLFPINANKSFQWWWNTWSGYLFQEENFEHSYHVIFHISTRSWATTKHVPREKESSSPPRGRAKDNFLHHFRLLSILRIPAQPPHFMEFWRNVNT